jgi:uncharacterized protein YabN with tetrapyrrole methylase and pyrophosphatase domain
MTQPQGSASKEADVYAIGAGIRLPNHLTVEAIEALYECSQIFTVFATEWASWMPTELVPKLRDLKQYYTPGILRRHSYERQVAEVINAAIQQRPVAYLTRGHPMFFDSVTQGLVDTCKEKQLHLQLLPAVSSIDTILADLNEDVAPGLQIFEASFLVGCRIEPRTDCPCILIQPDIFGTAYVAIGRKPSASAMAMLRDYLLRFYPSDHQVIYVTSAVREGDKAQLLAFPLSELGGNDANPQSPGASLFLPAVQSPIPDPEFLEMMANQEHFARNFQ